MDKFSDASQMELESLDGKCSGKRVFQGLFDGTVATLFRVADLKAVKCLRVLADNHQINVVQERLSLM